MDCVLEEIFVKGRYCLYFGVFRFWYYIYLVFLDGGFGVYVILGLDGCVKFGFDVEWNVKLNDYLVMDEIIDDFLIVI